MYCKPRECGTGAFECESLLERIIKLQRYPCSMEDKASKAKCLLKTGIRVRPVFPGDRTGVNVMPFEVFDYTNTDTCRYTHDDGRTYLIHFYEMADGRGWVHDFNPASPNTRSVETISFMAPTKAAIRRQNSVSKTTSIQLHLSFQANLLCQGTGRSRWECGPRRSTQRGCPIRP